MIYSAGWCPICSDGGDLFFLKNISSEVIFFACDACGCAWKESPDIEENWDVLEPIKIAPDGFSLASSSDIENAGILHFVFRSYSDNDHHFQYINGFVSPTDLQIKITIT